MWIVLAILKWIGIVLGGILGLLLFLIALVVFVPLRYRVQGSSREGMSYSFRFSWLCSAVAVSKKNHSDKIMLKIFGIPVKCLAGGDKKEPKTNASKQEGEKKSGREKPTAKETKKSKPEKETPQEEKSKKESPRAKRQKKRGREKKDKKRKKSFSFGRLSSIIGLVKDHNNRLVISRLWRELKRLIRYLLPTKVHGTVIFGTGDPCSTGLLLGGISMMPVVYQDRVQITPDFEEKHFEAEGFAKGRIRVIYFLRLVLRLYQDRELKRLWKQINNVKKEAA